MAKVLISDKLSSKAEEIFKKNNINVTINTELSPEQLSETINDFDGLAIRSNTKVTKEILKYASNLKVIGRAGIGVDNVDIEAATANGTIVMNTPFGNSITTAEHTIALMMSLARNIPNANSSTHQGKWEKSKYTGIELYSKILGMIGCGNIGSIVADRAKGLKMHIKVYDPYLTEERATEIGVEKVEFEELLKVSDFITLHVPLTKSTKEIINSTSIKKMKDGVKIINCARGGLVNENDLADAIKSGRISGAAFDVFSNEPAKDNVLFGLEKIVVTPHLGASTEEAQENVAIQVAEQISDYLINGAVGNALNMPSITAEEAKIMTPWLLLAGHLGTFVGQLTQEPIKAINILYDGSVSSMNLEALNCSVIAGIMRTSNPDVNLVSAPIVAKDRGIKISTTTQDKSGVFAAYIKVTVVTETMERSVAGTVFSDDKPRFIQIKGINIDAEVGQHMLYTTNVDTPGIIGILGKTMAENGVNIANFTLGRSRVGGEAIALLYLDTPITNEIRNILLSTGVFNQVRALEFDVNY